MNKVLWIIVLLVVLGGLYWAMNSSTAPATPTTGTEQAAPTTEAPAAPAVQNALTAGDQKAGKEVVVSSVTLNQDATVVVHKDAKGAPGAVLGTVTLKAGSYTDVKIALTEAIKVGDTVYPMLHPDTNGDGKYTPNEEGNPLTDAQGAILMVAVKVK